MEVRKRAVQIEFDNAERGILKDAADILDDVLTHMENYNCDQIYLDSIGGHHYNWIQTAQEFLANLADDENEMF